MASISSVLSIHKFTGNKEYSFYEISPIASGSLMMIASGSMYLVAAYSSDLQTELSMTSSEISTFTFVLAAGSWLGIVPMAFTDIYGPKIASLIGALMILIGYLVIAGTANGTISLSSSWVIFFGFIIGHGSAWCQVGAFFTNIANTLPEHRGAVFGLLQANYALSSGIFTQLLEIFGFGVPTFLLVSGVVMCLTILISWPSNHYIIGNNNNTDTLLIIPLAIIISIISIMIAIASIIDSMAPHIVVLVLFGIYVVGVFILSTVIVYIYGNVVFKMNKNFDKNIENDKFELNTLQMAIYTNRKDDGESEEERKGLLKKSQKSGSQAGEEAEEEAKSMSEIARTVSFKPSNENANQDNGESDSSEKSSSSSSFSMILSSPFVTALKTLRFWLIFFTLAVGSGAGLTVLYNIAKIIDAHSDAGSDDNVHSSLKTNSVALFSAFNTGGRIIFGFLSDILSVKKGISRAWLLSANCILMAAGTFMISFVIIETFKYVVIICAFSYGGFMSLVPALIADIYGTTTYGAFFTLTSFAPIIGVELLYNILSVHIYDQYTDDDGIDDDTSTSFTCFDNPACFKLTFLIISLCSIVASIAATMVAKLSQRGGIAR